MSQSLLHQVFGSNSTKTRSGSCSGSVSIPSSSGLRFQLTLPRGLRLDQSRLNPFFIRSSVPTRLDLPAELGRGLNPFFIRSSVPTARAEDSLGERRSQSLLHQVFGSNLVYVACSARKRDV